RKSLQRLGGFNECYVRHKDLELMTRCFERFEIVAVKEFLVKNRPNPVQETFDVDIQKLCRIKQNFLSDMKHAVDRRGGGFAQEVIDAHTKDIVKRKKDMDQEMVNIIRNFLSISL